MILETVSNYVYDQLTQIGVQCTKAEGAFYMMVGFDKWKNQLTGKNLKTSVALANYLLDQYHVALLPGSDFGFKDDELFFRLAFVDFDGKLLKRNLDENILSGFKNIQKLIPNLVYGVSQLSKFVNEL
jgi:aspartate aminotransferase